MATSFKEPPGCGSDEDKDNDTPSRVPKPEEVISLYNPELFAWGEHWEIMYGVKLLLFDGDLL